MAPKVVVSVVFALFTFCVGCFTTCQVHARSVDIKGAVVVDGLERTYIAHIPSRLPRTGLAPLLIALHGGGGSGRAMERLTRRGFNRLADKEGFAVVYPDAIDKHWNDGRGLVIYRSQRERVNDVGFISALIDHFSERFGIDRRRVYVVGMSNGALMAYRLACELPQKIAAIASVAGGMPENLSRHCPASRPVPVLIIQGEDDPVVPWDGGKIRFGRLRLGRVLSVLDAVDYWSNRDRCSYAVDVGYLPDRDPRDGTRVWKKGYAGCALGTEVVLYGIEGGGHTWPGGYQYLPEWLIGRTTKDINANEVVWRFFKELSGGHRAAAPFH